MIGSLSATRVRRPVWLACPCVTVFGQQRMSVACGGGGDCDCDVVGGMGVSAGKN